MKVNVKRGFYGREGNVIKGMTLDVDDRRARELIDRGLVTEVRSAPKPAEGETKKPGRPRKADREE
jgi:hypothetical protein